MSKSDIIRFPKIANTTITESDDMGEYTFTVSNDRKRAQVRGDRVQKREMAQSGAGIKRRLIDTDTQEQMREVLLSKPYTGPVGTSHTWVQVVTEEERDYYDALDMSGSHEVRMSGCKYGCKVYLSGDGREFIHHSSVYGHQEASIEPLKPVVVPRETRKIEPVVSRTRRMVSNDSERENYRREREMRDLGFGGRYGIHL